MAIKRLPVQLANQIAAGEVVERPSSVVKELVENSLDAGATSVEIDIEKGGHKRIRIKDNGGGIDYDDLVLALSPHSTSKIACLDDLENIASLGFRGEALASISSVSRLTLTSKPATQTDAWTALANGREMDVEIQPAAHPNGTTIDVCDLFYNTPARKKFMRAEKTEFQHIDDIIKRIALSRPRTSFVLKHNGKVIRRWHSANTDYENKRVAQVCGNQFASQAKCISLNYEGITLNAWVGDAMLMRSATDMQFSFVNGRAMRDKLLLHAIRQAYEGVYDVFEQPAYVLFLNLSPAEVDVNVHPAKHEVRFHQARHVHDLVCKAFQDALSDAQGSDENHQTDYAPSHDYIQPLRSSEPNQPVSNYTSHSNGGGSGGGHFQRPIRPTEAATSAYTHLMTESESGFYKVAQKGLMKVKNDKFEWLPAQQCIAWWIEEKLNSATMAQPLLMPISVTSSEKLEALAHKKLEESHFNFSVNGHKIMLKQVPATLRQLPWGRLFPNVIDTLNKIENYSVEHLSVLLASHIDVFDTEIEQSFQWFMALPFEKQQAWTSRGIKTQSVDNFIHWIGT
ncbi:DNA mismatch repair endonuclease MutL [Alteromonas sp. 5E99-2]|uniref:DNA mismatch repair endonuclease MutL n=1 Tax=Alteromonas sp. 5E99-2 TaxID=2817683 RepID=UPI001A996AB7|nr:DNA mismatch repair endonuclease MutL [Alteromonas sp. 5E99-2]MBO1255794.1 DNA mismatch repair endonuclease MutL [Alteromonas sp. 5E99-2]